MAVLAWLLIPLFAAVGAGLWGSWATTRSHKSGDGLELAGYARFREAMESKSPTAPGGPDSPDASDSPGSP